MSSDFAVKRQARKDAGVCVDCGGVRGTGAEGLRCEGCRLAHNARQYKYRDAHKAHFADYKREWRKAKHTARIAEGLCTVCGKRLARKVLEVGGRICRVCLDKGAAYWDAKERRRRSEAGFFYPRRVHGAVAGARKPEGVRVERRFYVGLDIGAVAAVKQLKTQDLARRQAVATRTGEPMDTVFQTARVVREAIGEFASAARSAPVRDRGAVGEAGKRTIAAQFGFGADAQTVAIVERHAAVRGGNLSWAVCDLLVAAAFGGFAVQVGFGGEREARRDRLSRFDPHGDGGW